MDQIVAMGGMFSRNTADKVANKGQLQQLNNTITVNESVEIHNDVIIVLLLIITVIVVIKFVRETCANRKSKNIRRYQSRNMLNTLLTTRAPAAPTVDV